MASSKNSSLYSSTSVLQGNIVYSMVGGGEKGKAYWTKVRDTAESEVGNLLSHVPKNTKDDALKDSPAFNAVIASIIQQAEAERAKEIQLLTAMGIDVSQISVENFVRRFNEILGAKEIFEADLRNLKDFGMLLGHESDPKSLDKFNSFVRRATLRARERSEGLLRNIVYTGAAQIAGGANIAGTGKKIINKMRPMYKKIFEQDVNRIIEEEFRRAYYTSFAKEGRVNEMEVLIQKIKTSEFKKILIKRTRIDVMLGRVAKEFENFDEKNFSKKDVIENVITKTAMSTGAIGDLSEIFYALNFTGFITNISPGVNYTKETTQIKTQIAKADGYTLLMINSDTKANVDPNKYLTGRSLKQNRKNWKEFDLKELSRLNNSFIELYSQKDYDPSYVMSKGFKGFSGGGPRPIEEANEYASKAGIYFDSKFYDLAYNTMYGAVGQGHQPVVKESIENGVIAGVMRLLFDDWDTIGTVGIPGTNQKIHTFLLNGIRVPSSVYLFGLADSLNSAGKLGSTDMLDVKVQMTNVSVAGVKGSGVGAVDSSFNRTEAFVRNKNKFSIHFFASFNNFVKGL